MGRRHGLVLPDNAHIHSFSSGVGEVRMHPKIFVGFGLRWHADAGDDSFCPSENNSDEGGSELHDLAGKRVCVCLRKKESWAKLQEDAKPTNFVASHDS